MKKYQICKNRDLCWGRLTLFYLTPRTPGHVLRHAVLNKKTALTLVSRPALQSGVSNRDRTGDLQSHNLAL